MRKTKGPQDIFCVAFVAVMLKFMLGGMSVFGVQVPVFTGSEFAVALAALGSIHSLSKHVENIRKNKE